MLVSSTVESARFGIKVYRAAVDVLDVRALAREIVAEEADLVVLRLPCDARSQVEKLKRTGFPYVVADTLVQYVVDFSTHDPKPPRNEDLHFEPFQERHAEEMARLVAEIFRDYRNHYDCNPHLDRRDFLAGYQEWAGGFAQGNQENKIAWIVRRDGISLGFCTCSLDTETGRGEGVLYGVSAAATGGGVYGDMIRFSQRQLKDAGMSQMTVSTQVENFAVQKVRAREGFAMNRAQQTVHVNAFLSHSAMEKVELPFRVDTDKIAAFGETSGDFNPLHFDDEAAREAGFEGRIAHALVAQAEISRIYGAVSPGHGTAFLFTGSTFLAPVYPDRDYRLVISFPLADEERGLYESVAQLRDAEGRICLIAYSDLMQR